MKKIREYNSQTDTWSVREFPTSIDYAKFISSQFKLPGEYNLKNTDVWCKVRNHYLRTGHYCDEVINSKKFYAFWTEEAIKCIKGVIIDGIFVPGYYYFYLNYCPIVDMIKKKSEFVEVWDSDLHFFLYVEMCLIKGKHALVNKKRRWGLSYKVTSMAVRDAYLLNNQTIKIITKQEPPLKGTWEFIDGYKSFLNEHTGWSRSFASDKFKLLDFRLKIKIGNKQVERGRKNVIKGIVTANSPSGGVGGQCHPKGTRILTTEGFKNVEDIILTDLVIGKDGKPKKIKQLFTGVGNIYKVSFEKFEDLYVTENHRLHLQYIRSLEEFNFPTETLFKNKRLFEFFQSLRNTNVEHPYADKISKIKDIELVGPDNFYGFECEDHLYTVNDYQITHNSSLIFMEEAGINSTLDKTFEFIKPTLQIGGLTTGLIIVAGSVGELKECEPLRKFTYSPDENDFLGVPDLVNPEKSVSLFIPVFWNYVHEIKDAEDNVIGYERCYDDNGNSNVVRAKELILETGLLQARKDPASYALFKSQYPETLEDLYGARETNIFPIAILSKQSFALDEYKPITIDIIENSEGKLTHSLISKPIVTDFPLKNQSYREGAICMLEPPIENPPPYLYFAGVDPVKSLQGIGESLMSVHIFQNFYVENNELKGGKLVAWYTGRNEDTHVTFRKVRDLLNYYNAAAVVESDQSSFIDWMIADKQNYRHRLLKRSQVPILKDLVPNSAIGDEYGVRMNTGGTSSRVKDYMHTKIIDYVSDVLSERILDDGTKIPVYGVERIKDQMLIKEMLNYNNKGNYDRIVSFGLALLTAAVYESRQVIHKKSSFSEPAPVVHSNQVQLPIFNSSNYKINVLTTKYNKFR